MDLIIVRENTEGLLLRPQHVRRHRRVHADRDIAFSIRKITAKASSRVARAAFELARDRRKKVTAVHKANVVKMSDGLFLREVRKVAAEYPDVQLRGADRRCHGGPPRAQPRPVRRDRHDQHVRGHPVRRSIGTVRQSRTRRLASTPVTRSRSPRRSTAQLPTSPAEPIANPTSLILSAAMLLDWRGRRDGNAAACARRRPRSKRPSSRSSTIRRPARGDIGGTLGTDAFAARRLGSPAGRTSPPLPRPEHTEDLHTDATDHQSRDRRNPRRRSTTTLRIEVDAALTAAVEAQRDWRTDPSLSASRC